MRPPALGIETNGSGDAAGNAGGSAASTASDQRTSASDAAGDTVLARVNGRPITAGELLVGLRQRDAQLLNFHLNILVGERLARIDADRLGLVIQDADVSDRARTHEAAFVAQLDGASLERVLREEMGVDPAAFRARLVADARRELLTERVVRAFTLAQETARVRIIVAPAVDVGDAVQRHTAGESFADIARDVSRDPTGRDGGLVPFVVRSERSRLARLAFRTDVGALGGPLAIEGEAVELLLLVESITAPVVGTWNDVRGTVEASLAEHEVSEEEYLQWQLQAERTAIVDLEPLSRLIGEELR